MSVSPVSGTGHSNSFRTCRYILPGKTKPGQLKLSQKKLISAVRNGNKTLIDIRK